MSTPGSWCPRNPGVTLGFRATSPPHRGHGHRCSSPPLAAPSPIYHYLDLFLSLSSSHRVATAGAINGHRWISPSSALSLPLPSLYLSRCRAPCVDSLATSHPPLSLSLSLSLELTAQPCRPSSRRWSHRSRTPSRTG
jgi:hypothetical protein